VAVGALVPVVLLFLVLLSDDSKGPTLGVGDEITITEGPTGPPEQAEGDDEDSAVTVVEDLAPPLAKPATSPSSEEHEDSHADQAEASDPAEGEEAPSTTAAPASSPPTWQTSFVQFAKEVQEAVSRGDNLERLFSHKEITWTVTFSSFRPESRYLSFSEAESLRLGNPEIDVDAHLTLAAADQAARLAPGSKVTLRGKIGFVVFAQIRGRASVMIGPRECMIEQVVRQDEPGGATGDRIAKKETPAASGTLSDMINDEKIFWVDSLKRSMRNAPGNFLLISDDQSLKEGVTLQYLESRYGRPQKTSRKSDGGTSAVYFNKFQFDADKSGAVRYVFVSLD